MSVTIFVLGRPGSGKSSSARRIKKLMLRRNCRVERINDYKILQDMSKRDFIRFAKIGYGGFNVIDWSVFDIALIEEERMAEISASSAEVFIIEFARSDYYEALKKFNKLFLQNAYFLFLDADIDTCIKRIRNRVKNKSTSDDYFVSEDILRSYYQKQELTPDIIRKLGVDSTRLVICNNDGSRDKFDININRFVNYILEQHPYLTYEHKMSKAIMKAIHIVHSHEKKAIFAKAINFMTHIPQFETRFL